MAENIFCPHCQKPLPEIIFREEEKQIGHKTVVCRSCNGFVKVTCDGNATQLFLQIA